jgi:cytochrome c-type biogenesis protein CcmE
MKTRGRVLFLAALATVSVVLIFNAIQQSQPYLTVTQVVENSDRYQGKEVQVIGVIADIPTSDENLALRFRLSDGQESISVVYEGPVPQNLRIGAQAVIIGRVSSGSVLEASSMLVKCPSRYADESRDHTGLDYTFYAVVGVVALLGIYLLVSMRRSSRKRHAKLPVSRGPRTGSVQESCR